ncbi:MAG: adenylate/guanylate cyclase domain-containing protein [Sulfuritalea sp.]|nr:adenylate/guanylate cyclase domain-containing protein [Sulfuritalea sp.]
MNSNTTRMDRLTLRFADAELERAFAEEQARKSLRPIRIALVCAAAITLFFLWPALVWVNSPIQEQMPGIAAMVLATVGLCYALTHRRIFLYRHQWMMLAMACVMSLGMVRALSASPTLEASGFFLMAMHLFSIYGVFRLRFPAAVAGGWISMALYLILLSALGLLHGINMFRHAGALLITNLWGMLICYQMDLALRRAFLAVRDVAVEHERSERLLLNILPAELAQELSATGSARPARHESVTILFTDFSGFTQVASSMPAERMVAELNEIFAAFDDITDACGVEKIKTIGDAYMAAAGLPKPCADHAQRCVRAGLSMIDYLENRNRTAAFKWSLRVGVHSGPVVAGVVGKRKYAFDIWGDTVNIASRLESSGEVNKVNISAYTFDLVRDKFECEYRGKLAAKGKGEIDMYFALRERAPAEEMQKG